MKPAIFINDVLYSTFENETKRNIGRAKLLNRGMVKSKAIVYKMYNVATGDLI